MAALDVFGVSRSNDTNIDDNSSSKYHTAAATNNGIDWVGTAEEAIAEMGVHVEQTDKLLYASHVWRVDCGFVVVLHK